MIIKSSSRIDTQPRNFIVYTVYNIKYIYIIVCIMYILNIYFVRRFEQQQIIINIEL